MEGAWAEVAAEELTRLAAHCAQVEVRDLQSHHRVYSCFRVDIHEEEDVATKATTLNKGTGNTGQGER